MKADFRISLFGYDKGQVKEYITRITAELETAIALKNEMRDQNNILKNELIRFRSMEQEISSAIITAQATASGIIREGEESAATKKEMLKDEIQNLAVVANGIYSRLDNAIQMAEDVARGFEQELTELKIRKEAFLKVCYPFDSMKDKEAGEAFKLSM